MCETIIYLRGNHELRGDYGDRFLDYFALNNGRTYDVITIGDTSFLLLDSWEDKPAKTPGHAYCQWNMDELFRREEADWLEEAMKDSRWMSAKRRVVICHGAAYSHFDACRHMPFELAKMTDRYFGGAKPEFRVNLWLAGHVLRYMRSIPGTTEIVAEVEPTTPQLNGLTYSYPVLTVAGPQSGVNRIASCYRVDADEEGFRVRSWNQKDELLEYVRMETTASSRKQRRFGISFCRNDICVFCVQKAAKMTFFDLKISEKKNNGWHNPKKALFLTRFRMDSCIFCTIR